MTKDKTPLYRYPAVYARDHGELEQYRASYKANLACKKAIEDAISEHYRDNILSSESVRQVMAQFEPDRIAYILAVTVREKDWDGRISRDNKRGRKPYRCITTRTVSAATEILNLWWIAPIRCFSIRL